MWLGEEVSQQVAAIPGGGASLCENGRVLAGSLAEEGESTLPAPHRADL